MKTIKPDCQTGFLQYLKNNPELLKKNYLLVDLVPGTDKSFIELSDLHDLLKFPYINEFMYNNYTYEIREHRYYYMPVSEFTRAKEDLNLLNK